MKKFLDALSKRILMPEIRGLLAIVLALFVAVTPLAARDDGPVRAAEQIYIVVLQDPPAALYDGRDLSLDGPQGPLRMDATAPASTGERKLNIRNQNVQAYRAFLDQRQQEFAAEAAATLGRDIDIVRQLNNATNGLLFRLSEDEAALLATSPSVLSIRPDEVKLLETYAGPPWIGAPQIWSGDAGNVPSRGEGVVVGILDTGINWEHPSFSELSSDGYLHVNPYGSFLGLCTDPEVSCNNKLVGVYDFVEDNPNTEFVELYTKGKDDSGHGSHVAGTVLGNPANVALSSAVVPVSGVAPRANLVSYRVCHENENGGSFVCPLSATLSAIDQAISDGVDVINFSVGGGQYDPWSIGNEDRAYLGARAAGIFIASSAGNEGPNESSITNPSTAPWITAVGNATHDQVQGNLVGNFAGGDLPAPAEMVGASRTDGTGQLAIVHAKDFGNALCGAGPPESGINCAQNTGQSNPWAGQRPFNGEIVVCDRGTYGRVEKGKNLLQAGAGGYILANTVEFGESIVADQHCLPASHVGKEDGDELRAWLRSGSGHRASISDSGLVSSDTAADELNFTSSRGPAPSPVNDTMKPNLIAPGTSIVAPYKNGSGFAQLSGTSMSSPHVAGAAALLKAVNPNWDPSTLSSVLEMTATPELAKDENGQPATTQQVGAGRPQLGEAVNAGLYLDVTFDEFLAARPAIGGEPKDLNLTGLVDSTCRNSCSFTRTVTDLMGGGTWTATAQDFPAGTQVTITPATFTLGAGAEREIRVDVDHRGSNKISDWINGRIRLSAAGSPDLYLNVSAYAYGGDIPSLWSIADARDSGWRQFAMNGLVGLPNATFTTGGLVKQGSRTEVHIEDPTNDNPYDGGEGVFTQWYSMPQGVLWLHADTPASTAADIDLYVGVDLNGNGRADKSEMLCESTTPADIESCDLYDEPPGNYWIVVQNWTGTLEGGDELTLRSAAIGPENASTLAASGPGITRDNEFVTVRLSWDNINALPGETWLGAVGVGSSSATPANLGVIPVRFNRTGIDGGEAVPLMHGRTHRLALAAGQSHDRVFFDVPPGTDSFTVSVSAVDQAQSDTIQLDLVPMDYATALDNAPFTLPAPDATPVASASGAGGVGPSATVSGGVQSARWYALISNTGTQPAALTVTTDVTVSTQLTPHRGLWEPNSRPGLAQGFDFNWSGPEQAPVGTLIWYTYDEVGMPAWYISSAPVGSDNMWTADLLRVTNDGATQQFAAVGSVSVTTLATETVLFTTTLFGSAATDRMQPLSALTCPQVNGGPKSYTGIWFRGQDGLGGASVVVNAITQAQIHYLFDARGLPRWFLVQDTVETAPINPTIPILQVTGYCTVCDPAPIGIETVGMLERSFDSETTGSWTLDYVFGAPLEGSVQRTEDIVKLTPTLDCQ